MDTALRMIGMNHLRPSLESHFSGVAWPAVEGGLVAQARALAQTFAALAGDVALVIDEAGLILGAAQGEAGAGHDCTHDWEGRAWADTVSPETQGKVALMLRELAQKGQARRREINHRTDDGQAVALACTAVRLGEHGPSLVVGRDLSAVAALQQRLVLAQAQMEAGYWQARRDLEPAGAN